MYAHTTAPSRMVIEVPSPENLPTAAYYREVYHRNMREVYASATPAPTTGRERRLAALRTANANRAAAAAARRAANPGAYTPSGRRSRARLTPEQRVERRRQTLRRNTLGRNRQAATAADTIRAAYIRARERRAQMRFSPVETSVWRDGVARDYKLTITNFTPTAANRQRIADTVATMQAAVMRAGQRTQVVISAIDGENNQRTVSTKMGFQAEDFAFYEQFLEDLQQSWFVGSRVEITVKVRGGGGGSGGVLHIPGFLKKTGVTIIKNEDDSCGLRALVLGAATDVQRRNLLKPARAGQLDKEVAKLAEILDRPVDQAMQMTDFDAYSEVVGNKVEIYTRSTSISLVYETECEGAANNNTITLFWDSQQAHYHLIHKPETFLNGDSANYQWCFKCRNSIRREFFANHKCIDFKCKCCQTRFDTAEGAETHFIEAKWRKCPDCNLPIPSDECQAAHKCHKDAWRCDSCKKWIGKDRREDHSCGETKCFACGDHFTGDNHRCFIKPLENKEVDEDGVRKETTSEYWVYDFESCMVDGNKHQVDTVCAAKLYSDEAKEFSSLQDFMEWVLRQKKTTFIAHNARSYDGWMVWKWLLYNTKERPNNVVLAGNKVMHMSLKSNRFMDSLNHVACALDGLPKMFGLGGEYKKGFFPYTFNTLDNSGYVGPLPAIKHFSPDMMKSGNRIKPLSEDELAKTDDKHLSKREQFFKWYAANKDMVYDLDKERLEYCQSDVQILKHAMERYRDAGIEMFGLDPLRCPTIASYCMKNYRTNYMPEEQLAVLKKDEYAFVKRQFAGGRTNATRLYRKWTDEELAAGKMGHKVDVQSLYPSVQFYDEMPVGVPKWDNEERTFETSEDMMEYATTHFGFINCDLDCPPRLFHPVIPEKKDGKLIFDLLPKRDIVVSSVELEEAIRQGYTVKKTYMSLVFEKSTELFKKYVASNLKTKVEASGPPKDDLETFIEEHEKRFGFRLEKERLVTNPGMRALAKISLNSLWGKLGQKHDQTSDTYCTEVKQWASILARHNKGEVEIKDSIIVGDSLHVKYQELSEDKTCLARTNLACAAMVTSQARLRLYSEMAQLGERVLYFDTDSILYEYEPGQYNVADGKFLGEWETEETIKEYAGVGPKSYAAISLKGEECTKMKGFTLNHENAQRINLQAMKKLIDGDSEFLEARHLDFVRKGSDIRTVVQSKQAGFNYTKRRLVGKYNTVPHGWVGEA